MPENIYTIGYEKSALEDFIAALRAAKISTLIDVRAIPLSRKRGFSRNVLEAALKDSGIGYVYLRGLGNPKKLRPAGEPGSEDFVPSFTRHMKGRAAQTDLARAAEISKTARACLLCFERDPLCCHRRIVAAHLAEKTGQKIENLFVPEKSGQLALL